MAIVVDQRTFGQVLAAARKRADPAAAAARSARARKSKQNGADFEAEIVAGQLGPDGRPVLRLVQLPTGGQFRGGRFVPVKSPFDFVGGYVRGPGIFFDAKAVDAASHRTGLEVHNPDILKPQQREHLANLAGAGQLAGVLVRCGPRADYRWLPGLRLFDVRTVKWDDGRWVILGPIRPGAAVPFGVLARWHGTQF